MEDDLSTYGILAKLDLFKIWCQQINHAQYLGEFGSVDKITVLDVLRCKTSTLQIWQQKESMQNFIKKPKFYKKKPQF